MPTVLDCGPCVLRSWQGGDEDALVRHGNDRAVWLNLRDRFPHPYTRADADNWVRLATSRTPQTDFAITVDGQPVGGIGLILHDDIERCAAEIGYWLGREYWGRGLATAAVRGLTDHAFRSHPLTRVFALVFAANLPSVHVLEKAGYRCEGRLRRAAIKDGVVHDKILYAITDLDRNAAS
jgi:[ribosomal protein S5]-alanine N-acetyltransferase